MMISSVIMAGGKARRMGGLDKALIKLNGKEIISYVIEKISKQTDDIVINTNRDQSNFKKYNLDIVTDTIEGFQGPLAGILSGMEWFYNLNKKIEWIVSSPVDSPFLPEDLIEKLFLSVTKNKKLIAVAKSHGRIHPVFAIWNMSLRTSLQEAINNDIKKIDEFTKRFNPEIVEFNSKVDPFFNINTPEDLIMAEKLLNTNNQYRKIS